MRPTVGQPWSTSGQRVPSWSMRVKAGQLGSKAVNTVKLDQHGQRLVNTRRDALANSRLGTTLRNHAKLALHRNVKVALSKLWNGWNRRTHGNSVT
ncbi:hypothetical protein HanOQP8_Chr16g0614981 [Helianthus annuus]|nr:hypothetical protein HanOQP8_Chr16g0614981 [Helianthus annuus]